MGQGYQKFKRRAVWGAWVKACLLGLALGLAIASGWLLADKLLGNHPRWMLYGMVGGGVAPVTAALMLVRLFPTDRRLARRLDASLDLGEKVQTMIAYRRDDTPMVMMQRQDTEAILAAAPTKRARSKRWWLHTVTPVLAMALAVSAMLVPAQAEASELAPTDPKFRLTEWQEMMMNQLINEVRTSNMEVTPKTLTVQELESLLVNVKNATRESVMKAAVVDAIVKVHGIVKDHTTYPEVGRALNASANEHLRSWSGKVVKGDPIGLGESLDTTRQLLEVLGETDMLTGLAAALEQALAETASDVADPLYRGFSDMKDALASVAAEADGMTTAQLTEALDRVFYAADGSLSGALQQQRFNQTVRDDVIVTLMAIFALTAEDLPPEVLPSSAMDDALDGKDDYDPGEQETDETKDNGGGLGTGDMLYGSNEPIYDPGKDAYVVYGEVLNEYYARISEMLVDGSLSPELEEMITRYFESLYDSTAKSGR